MKVKTNSINNQYLKPCPFCGHDASLFKGGFGEIAASCANKYCQCSLGSGIWFSTETAAINIWNKRSNDETV